MTQAAGTQARTPLFRLLIYGLILASSAAQFALVPIMPTYAHQLGLSGFQQGMVLGATGLAMLAVSVPAGTLSDRFGARRLTLYAGLLMALATIAQSLAGNFSELLAVPAGVRDRLRHRLDRRAVLVAGTAAGESALGGSVAAAGIGCVAGPAASGALVQHFGLATPWSAAAAGFALITVGLAALQDSRWPGPAPCGGRREPSGRRRRPQDHLRHRRDRDRRRDHGGNLPAGPSPAARRRRISRADRPGLRHRRTAIHGRQHAHRLSRPAGGQPGGDLRQACSLWRPPSRPRP